MIVPEKLTIRISRTEDGKSDYVQILSGDQFTLNIVLIANIIVIRDRRKLKNAE